MYFNENSFVYLNGEFVKARDAKTDFFGQTMHYGYGVFEGIRAYLTENGNTRIFKEQQHFLRLQNSARLLNMPFPWDVRELIGASYEVLKLNDLTSAYIRPLVYAPANMGFNKNEESFVVIEAWHMDPFLGEKLISVGFSSFERPNPRAFRLEAKACGHYVNSILASQEAKANGFDEALLFDKDGFIAEAPGANIFLEKDGKLYTPPLGSILPGITRQTVLELASENGWDAFESRLTKEDLLNADSAFFCGTAAEIVGISKVENHHLPLEWNKSLGAKIQKQYSRLVRKDKEKISLKNKKTVFVNE
ncbi:MAG: branched-chain amino acid transaminase [Chitinophagaceae bacterium]|nr:branched-chain amino acid transaminase [Chitinophagaceae bacterium]